MTGIYGVTENTDTELSQLVAGETAEIKRVRLKASCGDLERGQVLALNESTNLWESLATSGSDGESTARAILAQAVADDSAVQDVQAYFIGKYRYVDLVWKNGQTATQRRTALIDLADRGVVVDKVYLEATETTSSTTTTSTSTTSTSTTSTSTTTTTTTTTSTTTTT